MINAFSQHRHKIQDASNTGQQNLTNFFGSANMAHVGVAIGRLSTG